VAAPAKPRYVGPTAEQAVTAQNFMKTVMEPAAETLWRSVGFITDKDGEHDLSPKTDEDWAAIGPRADTVVQVLEGLRDASFKWDPDNTWNSFIDQTIAAVNENKAAGASKSVDAMYDAGEKLDKACDLCHAHWEKGEQGAL
jgi:hypothetical protein